MVEVLRIITYVFYVQQENPRERQENRTIAHLLFVSKWLKVSQSLNRHRPWGHLDLLLREEIDST